MQNREFEKKVQDQMEELKFTPADAVWDKVEAGLPKEKDRRWIIFVLLFVVLLTGSLFLRKNFTSNNTSISNKGNNAANQTTIATKETNSQAAKIESKKNNTNVNTIDSNLLVTKIEMPVKTDTDQVLSGRVNKKSGTGSYTKIKIRKGNVAAADIDSKDDVVAKNKSAVKTKATVKIKTKAPQPVAENEEIVVVPVTEEKLISETIDTLTANTPIVKPDSLIAGNKKNETDTIAVVKKDTAVTAKKERTKNNSKKWQYGIDVAAGSSAVKTGLFSNTLVYLSTYSSTVGGSSGTGISAGPNKPSTGLAFSGGFYTARNITDKWTFKTGLNYLYQSNAIKVGSKVDSAATFNFDINKSIAASSYFKPGSSVSYRNNFHLLEIPLLFQYKLSKISPFDFEAGPAISYLISSNALVYSNSSGAYFTGKDIFNKLLLSVNAGAGFTFAQQSRWPITIGYRFKYGISSVIKKSLSEQHFVNSMLYLKIPFKK